jgi:predicted ATP-dependent endonuclease of OLD family
MKIERIFISNFKSIPQDGVTLKFRDGMIALVGKNNAGKSNILEAIGILFGSKNPVYSPFPKDCFNDPTQPIIIEAEIIELDWGAGKSIGLSDQQCQNLRHEGKRVETRAGAIKAARNWSYSWPTATKSNRN